VAFERITDGVSAASLPADYTLDIGFAGRAGRALGELHARPAPAHDGRRDPRVQALAGALAAAVTAAVTAVVGITIKGAARAHAGDLYFDASGTGISMLAITATRVNT
jgi:hypothetical protein